MAEHKQAGAFGRMVGQTDQIEGQVERCGVWHDTRKGLQFALKIAGHDTVLTGDCNKKAMALLEPGDKVAVKWHPKRGFTQIERQTQSPEIGAETGTDEHPAQQA